MATIISNGNTTLSTASGFYRVESANLGCFSATALALTTTRYIPLTFANTGNVQGVVLNLGTISMTSRQVVVTLQENIASVWTDVAGATVTLNTEDITGAVTSGTYKYRGQYMIPCVIGTPKAVDTNANKWRWKVAHGTGTGTWSLVTSDATNPFHATWCDNAVSFTNNDILIVKDYVTIDQSATLGAVLGTGDTINGVSAIICSNINNPLPADVAYLKWADTPAASYTLTVGGSIHMDAYSGFRIGTATNRIPIAQRAIVTFTAPTAGTALARFITDTGVSASVYGGLSSIFLYGEIPTYQKTNLASDANTGQAHLIVEDNVDWVAGDTLVIGKQDTFGQGELTIYTVSSVSGNDITLTGNVLTNVRKAGATVIKLNSHGVLIQNTGTYSLNLVFTLANLQVSGVDLYNQSFQTTGTTYYYYLAALSATCRSQYLLQDVTHWTNTTTSNYLITPLIPPDGMLMQRCYSHRQHPSTAGVAYYANGHVSGRLEIKDCAILSQYSGNISIATNIRLTIENNSFENQRASVPFFYMTGLEGIFKNNKIWGGATSGGSVYVGACVNPQEISGNTYNKCSVALGFQNLTNVKCIDENSVFNSETANVVDIKNAMADSFPDYIFKNDTGITTFEDTFLPDMIVGGRYGFVNFNGVAGDDRMVYTYGKTKRDTTVVHTAGGSSFRFEPVNPDNRFDFSFDVPTGNIQNKTMTVAIWVKIGASAYYAGTHNMPRLKVTYDGTSVMYSTSAQSTDWQLLSCTFTPTTTTGKITVMLSGLTDATGTDRYFNWDDISILYPAGYKLDLGGLDIWDNALPVLPPIATVMSANDVWLVSIETFTTAGTAGKQLKDGLTEDNFLALN